MTVVHAAILFRVRQKAILECSQDIRVMYSKNSLLYETINYLLLFTCLIMHCRIFEDSFRGFEYTFTNSIYFLVQTSSTVGYGDLKLKNDVPRDMFLIFLLICGIVFFSYFRSRVNHIINLMSTSYRSLILKADDDMQSWLSVRDRDAGIRDTRYSIFAHALVTRKILAMYRSYMIFDIVGIVQEHDLFHKLSYKHQHIIIDSAFITFTRSFSYIARLSDIDSMRRLFSKVTAVV